MTSTHDDLDALKSILVALEPFDPSDQQRIVRWACEKLGLSATSPPVSAATESSSTVGEQPSATPTASTGTDIRSFMVDKMPGSNNEFAAAVAYFYRFEAPETQRKEFISAEDLQEACRLAGRERLGTPSKTLNNALAGGLLDKGVDRGTFRISTVGENLVAMTLPSGTQSSAPRRPARRKTAKKKTAKKKTAKKKTARKTTNKKKKTAERTKR